MNISVNDQEDLFCLIRIQSSSSSDNNEFSFSDSGYHLEAKSYDSPNIKLACNDSCCKSLVKTINVLPSTEEQENILLSMIYQSMNPGLKEAYLLKFKKMMAQNELTTSKQKFTFQETLS